ncbi:MAG TPA: di-heme oxidoredictase family protein [Candidatus Aquilonibacter sp.]|nr:di-heme oxidoredictase family protein [Candidatus Aquilonibacter sp.]
MLRSMQCTPPAGKATRHFPRFFPGTISPGYLLHFLANPSERRQKTTATTLTRKMTFVLPALFLTGLALSQVTDPGVQTGNRGTGAALSSVLTNSPSGILSFFTDGQARFQEVESVSGGANNGLGPRFNSNSCSSCHAQPAIGGSGAATNPQFEFTSDGVAPNNTMPSFITATGPTREARFPFFFNSNGTVNTSDPNGGVEDLFTVTGRSDAGSCNSATILPQPSFATAIAENNIIYRIPTPTFGTGLIENLDDSTLLNNELVNLNNHLGIGGAFNRNGNDGTITRFGWKAQNKSLHIFAGEAYNVEMGISNELFPQERPLPGEDQQQTGLASACLNLSGSGYPEDTANPAATPNSAVLDDVSAFANFMRFLAPPPTGSVVLNGSTVSSTTISTGASLFSSVGCALCHNPSPGTTQASNFTSSLSKVSVPAYSDIEIHHMGTGLADNVSQGSAGGDQFRTAPLWGLGQRIFLLHDGRTTNLITAIQDHAGHGSEATTVEEEFFDLNPTQQQEVLDFLRSL